MHFADLLSPAEVSVSEKTVPISVDFAESELVVQHSIFPERDSFRQEVSHL